MISGRRAVSSASVNRPGDELTAARLPRPGSFHARLMALHLGGADAPVGSARVRVDVDAEEERMSGERRVRRAVLGRDSAGQQERPREALGER